MDDKEILKDKLTKKMIESANIAKNELKYNPSLFFQMLSDHKGFETARRLINAKNMSDGFAKMWEFHRLDLTVEAIILDEEFRNLFTLEEIQKAENRLKQCGYEFKQSKNEADHDTVGWSIDEITASVNAYIKMLHKEISGESYNKAEINRELREGILKNRTKGSIEFRMQNISAVMDALCLPRINGYLPAKNIGTNVFNEIKQILENIKYIDSEKYEPTENDEEYESRSAELLKKMHKGKPKGIISPEKNSQNILVFKRDPLIKAWVLFNANGICEKCKNIGPFKKSDGSIFLEVHHLLSLADGGSDTIENAVALCPNCHRELHYSPNKLSLIDNLKNNIERFQNNI